MLAPSRNQNLSQPAAIYVGVKPARGSAGGNPLGDENGNLPWGNDANSSRSSEAQRGRFTDHSHRPFGDSKFPPRSHNLSASLQRVTLRMQGGSKKQ